MAKAAVRSKVVVLLLLMIHCALLVLSFLGLCVCACYVMHYFVTVLDFAIMLMRKRELVTLL